MASLVDAGQTEVVVIAIDGNVLVVALLELCNHLLDDLHATLSAGAVGRVVGVSSSTVPVALERLRVEGDLDAPPITS